MSKRTIGLYPLSATHVRFNFSEEEASNLTPTASGYGTGTGPKWFVTGPSFL